MERKNEREEGSERDRGNASMTQCEVGGRLFKKNLLIFIYTSAQK